MTVITGYVPVAETFGLAAEMRSATSGHAFWQCTFDHWAKVPESLAMDVIGEIRKRRGLSPEIQAEQIHRRSVIPSRTKLCIDGRVFPDKC